MVCLGKTMSTQTSDNNTRMEKNTLLYSAWSVFEPYSQILPASWMR